MIIAIAMGRGLPGLRVPSLAESVLQPFFRPSELNRFLPCTHGLRRGL
jgi:hypothetical protein